MGLQRLARSFQDHGQELVFARVPDRFRGLLVRWERLGAHYLALLQFACGLIAFQQAT